MMHIARTIPLGLAAMVLAIQLTTASLPASSPTGSQRARGITFDDIKFDIKPGDPFKRAMLPDEIEAMDGSKITIRGWILPQSVFKQKGVSQFVLVRDNMECCFGPGAALFDCIVVEMEPGKSTDFTTRPIAVEGTFSISEYIGPDGKHLAIYHLRGTSAK